MSKKTFALAPKPKTATLSEEQIRAYEATGAGHDTVTREASSNPAFARMDRQIIEEDEPEPTKRLSLDIPQSLHKRFKTACSATERKMVSELQAFIERRTEELEEEAGFRR